MEWLEHPSTIDEQGLWLADEDERGEASPIALFIHALVPPVHEQHDA